MGTMYIVQVSGSTFDKIVDSLGQPQDLGRDWARHSESWTARRAGRGFRYSHPATREEVEYIARYLRCAAGALTGGGFDPGDGHGAEARQLRDAGRKVEGLLR